MPPSRRRLNVVLIAPGFPPQPLGGGATHAFYLVQALGSIPGVRIHVIAQEPPLKTIPFTKRVRTYWVRSGQDLGQPPFGQFLAKAIKVIHHIKRNSGFDKYETIVLHGQHWGAISVAMSLKHVFDLPVVATIHKTPIGDALSAAITRGDASYCYFEWLATWPIDAFIAGSRFFQRELGKKVSNKRIELIFHGVPEPFLRGQSTHQRRQQLREKIGLAEGEKLVFCPVRFDPRKRVADFIAAAGLLMKEMPGEPIKFLITGGTNDRTHNELLRHGQEAGIAEKLIIRLLDFEEVPAAFRAASLVICPTDREGLGLSALEAMALGTPVIVTDAEGINEVIRNGVNGYSYASGETQHLAHLMATILSDQQLTATIGNRGRETVKSEFSHTTMADRHLEVYRSLTAQ